MEKIAELRVYGRIRIHRSFKEKGKKQSMKGEQQIKVENILKHLKDERVMDAVEM